MLSEAIRVSIAKARKHVENNIRVPKIILTRRYSPLRKRIRIENKKATIITAKIT